MQVPKEDWEDEPIGSDLPDDPEFLELEPDTDDTEDDDDDSA